MANSGIFSTGKEQRFSQKVSDVVVDSRIYNLIIGGVVAYGLILNYIICKFFLFQILQLNIIALMVGYLVGVFVGVYIVNKSNNPFISFLGYNLVVIPMGTILSICLISYSPAIVFQACGMTASIVVIMLCLGTLFPNIFLRMGSALFASLGIYFVIGIIMTIFHFGFTLYSYVGALIFSLYIAYDWVRANQYVHTIDNAVDSACDIYIDIINLFLRILSILGRRND